MSTFTAKFMLHLRVKHIINFPTFCTSFVRLHKPGNHAANDEGTIKLFQLDATTTQFVDESLICLEINKFTLVILLVKIQLRNDAKRLSFE